MTGRKVVELYYDVVSPYTLFAFETLCRYRGHWNMDLHLKPFLLGALFKGSGNQPPATNPNKAAYMMADWPRLAKYFDVQLKQPANFWEVIVKRGTLIPQRFITAVDMKHPELAEKVARECWQRIWFEDVDATEPDSLRAAAEKAGLSKDVIDDALARMTAPEVKDRLRAYTQEALDLGAFGAPFIVAHVNGKKEIFFGSDRFPVMAMVIGEEWKGPRPGSASRL
ncbi:hypothetical protein BaRGS_00012009 [Batillaria attramentaria]|uniref:Glutathione S-transferase kappa n=1 Tax=Batillaria attramentaria TaxID=370345 RepID=A0ABD0LBS7_9CAEN